MLLTKEEIELIRKLRTEKHCHPENLIIPSDEEAQLMEIIRSNMTLEDYLSLPEEEQKKWYINSNFMKFPIEKLYVNSEGKEVWFAPYYFEPWHPDILKRKY